jgi:beta-glucosidase
MLSNGDVTTGTGENAVTAPLISENWFENRWPNWESGPNTNRPTVYVPFEQRTTTWSFPPPNALRAELERHFNLVTDTVTGTGAAQVITRPSREVMATVDFAIIFTRNPVNLPGGTLWNQGWNGAINSYVPVSLQFRPYTADGPNVRRVSYGGHPVIAERYAGSPTGFRTVEGAAGRPAFGHAPTGHVTPPIILSNPATPIPGTTNRYWARENRSYFGQTSQMQNANQIQVFEFIDEFLPAGRPVIMGMDIWNPYIIAEVYDYVDAIFMSFQSQEYGTMLPMMLGQIEPSGLLPVQMPLDMNAVERQYEDMPRDMDVFIDSMGNAYDFGFGLNWSGVISDWRTERFVVPPIFMPQRQPIHRPEGIFR